MENSARLPSGLVGNPDAEQAAQQQQQAQQRAEQRRAILHQLLSSDARERLARIAMVRPEKAQACEDLIVRLAQSGQLRQQVTSEQLLSILDQSGGGAVVEEEEQPKQKKVIIARRKSAFDDSESEEDYGF